MQSNPNNNEISFANNPFERHDNEELSFLGRDLNKPAVEISSNHYGRNLDYELYGPIWIYLTLVIEFVILGHMTNYLADSAKHLQVNSELVALLSKKTADQSLKRIMKISFFLGVFYFGVPFVTYLMFKSKQAMEISYVQQLALTSYSYVVLIPASLLIFALQQFVRFKYLVLITVWLMHLFFMYKSMYDARKKYFDFGANKQMAWFVLTQSFVFMWIYKSYFLQV